MPSIQTPSETSNNNEADYFVDFDGTYANHEDESSLGNPENGPSDATPMNNNPNEPFQHMDRLEARDIERQDRAERTSGEYRNTTRRIWERLRRMVGAFVAGALNLILHREIS